MKAGRKAWRHSQKASVQEAFDGDHLQVEIVVSQLLLQAAFFQQVVDGATLAQIGLRHLYLRFRFVRIDLS